MNLAQLEAASNLATDAYATAERRRDTLKDMIKAIDALDEMSRSECLSADDTAAVYKCNLESARCDLAAKLKAMPSILDALEDAALAAAKAYNDAPDDLSVAS